MGLKNAARDGRGFTLVELVIVVVLIGIVVVVAGPRLAGRGSFDARGYEDQVIAALQYAQQSAVAERRLVCVALAANSINITRALAPPPSGSCGATALLDPATATAYGANAPAGVTLVGVGTALPVTLSFDASGTPSAGMTLEVQGVGNHCISLQATTGYVFDTPCP